MKITMVGAGNVGATTVKMLADLELASQIVLVDVVPGVPQGKALDIAESAACVGKDVHVLGTNTYEATAGSDICIITAGYPRKPGMTRDDLLLKNAEVVGGVAKELVRYSPETILICVTNPLDAMVYLVKQVTGLPRERVVGMAGILDAARFKLFIADELGCSTASISAGVLGSHGDTMVPLIDHTTIDGVPISRLIKKDRLDAIVERARRGGDEIVNYLKTGSASYAPASSITMMIEAIVKDKHQILPCSAYCQGEFGLEDVYIGVPVMLGRRGMEKIMVTELSEEELSSLRKSAHAVREQIAVLKL
jgi:malate dehydrogenase